MQTFVLGFNAEQGSVMLMSGQPFCGCSVLVDAWIEGGAFQVACRVVGLPGKWSSAAIVVARGIVCCSVVRIQSVACKRSSSQVSVPGCAQHQAGAQAVQYHVTSRM